MSKNLYQKYRPDTFDKVIGQETVLKDLKRRAEDNNFPQVMLLEGFTGSGKTTITKIIAKSILCSNKDAKGNPCNICDCCNTVDNELISNYYYERNSSNLGIDDMRALEEIAIKKTLSNVKSKVFYIDELQELSQIRTQKNILKLLEKPLKGTYFILGTMDGSKIDRSIKARCTLYKLQPHSVPNIVKYLLYICEQENINIDNVEKKQVIISIADTCMGSMRQAISTLERIIYSELWTVESLMKELSIVSNENLNVMINQLLEGNIRMLNNEINDDILKRIKYILNIIYKIENGLELNEWQKQQIKDIKKSKIEILNNTIASLNELIKFPYLPTDVIEFSLINIINKNKILYNEMTSIPVRQPRR